MDPGAVTVDTFRPLVGDVFTIRAADGAIQATLQAVRAAEGHGYPETMRAPFSIEFRGPADRMLQQGIHAVEHTAFGELVVLLVPTGASAEGARYEVVFG